MAAAKVGVGEEEYGVMCQGLKSLQNDFITKIDEVVDKIESLNCKEGGFYVENITPNIEKILSAIREIKVSIGHMQENELQMIESFLMTIDNVDTCC